MKFGGSSVASAERIMEVATLVMSFPQEIPIVVLSAKGKNTNKLLLFFYALCSFCSRKNVEDVVQGLNGTMIGKQNVCRVSTVGIGALDYVGDKLRETYSQRLVDVSASAHILCGTNFVLDAYRKGNKLKFAKERRCCCVLLVAMGKEKAQVNIVVVGHVDSDEKPTSNEETSKVVVAVENKADEKI
ncbi:hypothetical protein RYX36_020453 [Vicia faba]